MPTREQRYRTAYHSACARWPDYDNNRVTSIGLGQDRRSGRRRTPRFASPLQHGAMTADGRISYQLKRPWPDGRTPAGARTGRGPPQTGRHIPPPGATWCATRGASARPANQARSSAPGVRDPTRPSSPGQICATPGVWRLDWLEGSAATPVVAQLLSDNPFPASADGDAAPTGEGDSKCVFARPAGTPTPPGSPGSCSERVRRRRSGRPDSAPGRSPPTAAGERHRSGVWQAAYPAAGECCSAVGVDGVGGEFAEGPLEQLILARWPAGPCDRRRLRGQA